MHTHTYTHARTYIPHTYIYVKKKEILHGLEMLPQIHELELSSQHSGVSGLSGGTGTAQWSQAFLAAVGCALGEWVVRR